MPDDLKGGERTEGEMAVSQLFASIRPSWLPSSLLCDVIFMLVPGLAAFVQIKLEKYFLFASLFFLMKSSKLIVH